MNNRYEKYRQKKRECDRRYQQKKLSDESERQKHRERCRRWYQNHRDEIRARQKTNYLKRALNPKIENPSIKITMEELEIWIKYRHKYGDPAKYDWKGDL